MSGMPVALRSSDGPSALMTASASCTARWTASRSVSSPVITVRLGWVTASLACALLSKKWTGLIGRRRPRAEQTALVRIARDELRHLCELSQTIDALEEQI